MNGTIDALARRAARAAYDLIRDIYAGSPSGFDHGDR